MHAPRTALTLALTLAASRVAAQGRDDDAARRQLILQAGALRDRGDHEGALARLREAATRRMSPSLRLFIAQEEQSLQRFADALRDARQCAAEFEADPRLAHRNEFLANCHGIADAMAQRVARITVRLPAGVGNATVRVRGEVLPPEALDHPWELDPGPAHIEATAPGRERFERDLSLSSGVSTLVRVELPPRVVSSPQPDPLRPTPDPTEAPSTGVGAGPWVLFGGGVAAMALSGVFFALRGSELDARDALCRAPTGDCVVNSNTAAREANSHQDAASLYNTLSAVSLGVGAAVAAGGLVWFLVGSSSRRASHAALTLAPQGSGVTLGLRGTW